jgi:hypothetical protein
MLLTLPQRMVFGNLNGRSGTGVCFSSLVSLGGNVHGPPFASAECNLLSSPGNYLPKAEGPDRFARNKPIHVPPLPLSLLTDHRTSSTSGPSSTSSWRPLCRDSRSTSTTTSRFLPPPSFAHLTPLPPSPGSMWSTPWRTANSSFLRWASPSTHAHPPLCRRTR